jgi:hypothetical protein
VVLFSRVLEFGPIFFMEYLEIVKCSLWLAAIGVFTAGGRATEHLH